MIRFYRTLLRLYPRSFREAYGEEMRAVFARRHAERTGVRGRAGLVLEALRDVVPNALGAHRDILAQDLGYALRSLARAPGFSLTTVLVVAFAVGANTAAFSMADHVLVRPLPFPGPDRLVRIWERTPGYGQMELSPANYRDWKARSRSFESMGAFIGSAVNLQGAGEPRRVEAARVMPGLLGVLGVEPAFGRRFEVEDGRFVDVNTVLLSHWLWQSELGGDPSVVGRDVNLDGAPYRVVGIMPESFRFPTRTTALWVPIELGEGAYRDRNDNYLRVVARLADGVGVDQALDDLEAVAGQLALEYPDTNARTGANAYLMKDGLPERARLLLLALGGAALCILLLACANLTNLFLARAASREREMAVRAALGAGRERLVRQMATESAGLTLAGGVLGVVVGVAAIPLLARLVPTSLPIGTQPELDLRMLALAATVTVLTGVGFGVLPALRAGGSRGLGALREGSRGGSRRTQRLRSVLVSVQVAVSIVLLACSGLLTRAMWHLQARDPGFRTEDVLTLRTALPLPRYEPTEARHRFYSRVVREVEALPGVSAAAYTTGVPMVMGGGIWPVVVEGDEVVRDAANSASLRFVTPGFFDVLEVPLVRGRDVRDSDTFDAPFVAVVSESFAERYWPGQDPLGRSFEFAFFERTVVGVVRDIRVRGLEEASEPQVYLPHRQVPDGGLGGFYAPKDLVVRADIGAEAVLPAVRRIIREVDPQQPISDVQTMAEVVAGESASRRAQVRVLGTLAVIALLLAGVGLHGLLAYAVSMRSREIGIRLALGARRDGVAGLVLREALALTALGVIPGVLLALAAGRALGALLLDVEPDDPLTMGAAVALVVGMAVAGAVAPTLSAVRVSPALAMSEE